MDLATYQKCAERTMMDVNPEREMLNAALGICGEAAEVSRAVEWGSNAELLEESGDSVWYVAQMCKAHGESIADISPLVVDWNEDRSLQELWDHSGSVADMTKKLVFHKKPISSIVFFDSLQAIVTALNSLLGFYGWTITDACEHNNQKLLKRHANGFSHESANVYADREQAT